jgi:hypothetical protein
MKRKLRLQIGCKVGSMGIWVYMGECLVGYDSVSLCGEMGIQRMSARLREFKH